MLEKADSFVKTKNKFAILNGAKGSGKSTLAKIICDKLEADLYLLTEVKVDDIRTIINDSNNLSKKRVYLIDGENTLNLQSQNALLKFLEEPSVNTYILLETRSLELLVPTIISRATIINIPLATKEELGALTDNELIMDCCNTVGCVMFFTEIDFNELNNLVEKIIDNLERISLVNTFNIEKHVNKLVNDDFEYFLLLLENKIFKKCRESGFTNNNFYVIIKKINNLKVKLKYNINKQYNIDMFFIDIFENFRSS